MSRIDRGCGRQWELRGASGNVLGPTSGKRQDRRYEEKSSKKPLRLFGVTGLKEREYRSTLSYRSRKPVRTKRIGWKQSTIRPARNRNWLVMDLHFRGGETSHGMVVRGDCVRPKRVCINRSRGAKSSALESRSSPCELETTCPGVFAAGDVRSGTTKRCAFAVGDGALGITCVHQYVNEPV